MPTAGFQPPQGQQSVAQLQDWIIKLCRDLDYYMNNLDTVNISRLDARVIVAQSITAAMLNVTQLSAIAADLGSIVAGIITGAVIKTAAGNARMQLDSGFLTQYDSSNAVMLQIGTSANPYVALYDSGGVYSGGIAGIFTSILGLSIDTTVSTNMPIKINAGSKIVTIIGDSVKITAPNGFWVNGVRIA